MGIRWSSLMDTNSLFRTTLFIMTICLSLSVHNTIREKADERLYNVRRIVAPGHVSLLVHSRNDGRVKKHARCFIRNNEIINMAKKRDKVNDLACNKCHDTRLKEGSTYIFFFINFNEGWNKNILFHPLPFAEKYKIVIKKWICWKATSKIWRFNDI